MEYHPENAPPFDVLLGQFGRRLHPADPPVPSSGGLPYFAVTGHTVIPPFFAYWTANGGLAQFGYPLSELITETLEDGQAYQVQYFERARFELHPENQPPYEVLLGQFGRRILATVPLPQPPPPAPPPPSPATPPPPAPPSADYQVTASVSDSRPPRYGTVTVYASLTNNGRGVSGATMDTTWHFKTTDSTCTGGPSGEDGVMRCSRYIGPATVGYAVAIDVRIAYQGQVFTARTSFTPTVGEP
jgi:hypothetical protein